MSKPEMTEGPQARQRFEEVFQFNVERRIMDSLAPEKWEELKAALQKKAGIAPIKLKCEEDAVNSFSVIRYRDNGDYWKALRLHFDPAVPRITWHCRGFSARKGTITFRVQESSLLLVIDEESGRGEIVTFIDLIELLFSCASDSKP